MFEKFLESKNQNYKVEIIHPNINAEILIFLL